MKLQEAVEQTLASAWQLLVLERDICSAHTTAEDKKRLLVQYRKLSLEIFGEVRADRK